MPTPGVFATVGLAGREFKPAARVPGKGKAQDKPMRHGRDGADRG